jgi:hypothetical protein
MLLVELKAVIPRSMRLDLMLRGIARGVGGAAAREIRLNTGQPKGCPV